MTNWRIFTTLISSFGHADIKPTKYRLKIRMEKKFTYSKKCPSHNMMSMPSAGLWPEMEPS